MQKEILELLSFYTARKKPLTALEIWRNLPISEKPPGIKTLVGTLEALEKEKKVKNQDGFWSLTPEKSIVRREQDALTDEKWRLMLRYAHWFQYIPFIKFVCVNGSMVLGDVRKESDFDVIIAVAPKRIFLTRYLTLFLFTALKIRRMDDMPGSSPNKFCFNHFITTDVLRMPLINEYSKYMYKNLVPIYGEENTIGQFIAANAWSGINIENINDARFIKKEPNPIRNILERILHGAFGDFLEYRVSKPRAIVRLREYARRKDQSKGRVVISDDELVFHFSIRN